MDTYTVVQVQPNATVSTTAGAYNYTKRPHVFTTPGQARAYRTRAARESNRRSGYRVNLYRILHTHIDPMTYEVTTNWID